MLVDADISDPVRAQVADWMRRAPVIDFIISDEDPELGEEATPAPRKKANQEYFCRTKQEHRIKNGVVGV